MKYWAKPLLSFSLLCYIAVSSIAAVHAFPMSMSQNTDNSGSVSVAPTAMPCHQAVDTTVDQEIHDVYKANSFSLCEIFCAAMGHAISHEFAYLIPITRADAEITFIQPDFYKGDHSLEPHPPK
jgi:hypothetical protein